MNLKFTIGVILILWASINLKAQDHKIYFGFLGNSITIGSGLSNAKEGCYPSQIANLLTEKYGDTCVVNNYAVSGRTLLKKGDYPLWNEDLFKQGWQEAPDICFICLGTNDTKPQNWDSYGDEFIDDYLSMMDTFKLRNPNVKYIICYPPPAFNVVWDIRNSILVSGVIPAVDSVLKLRDAVFVDFYHPLLDSVNLFPDYIHPDTSGAKVMAKIAFDKIVESDIVHQVNNNQSFIMSLDVDKNEIKIGDTATISWTTRNAVRVTLNGETVEESGSANLTPTETTEYKLIATGIDSKDSLTVTQNVYVPELTNISVTPARSAITNGETKDLKVTYYDQKLSVITDATYNTNWSVSEGEGNLTNETDTSVTFISTTAGKSKVKAEIDQISSTATITVESATNITAKQTTSLTGYPNPCTTTFNIPLNLNGETQIAITIFDIVGKNCLSQNFKLNKSGNYTLPLNVKDLNKGLYVYKLDVNGKISTGKLNKKN